MSGAICWHGWCLASGLWCWLVASPLDGGSWQQTGLSYPQLPSVTLSYPQLSSVTLSYPQLSSVTLSYPQLSSVTLSYPQLPSVTLSYPQLSSVTSCQGPAKPWALCLTRRGDKGGQATLSQPLLWAAAPPGAGPQAAAGRARGEACEMRAGVRACVGPLQLPGPSPGLPATQHG